MCPQPLRQRAMCVVSRRLHTTHFFKPSALLCAEAGPPVVWGGCFPLVSFASGAPWFDCFRSSFVRFLSSFRATLASSLAFASSGVTGAFCMRFEAFISALKFFKAFFVFLCLSSFRSCFFFLPPRPPLFFFVPPIQVFVSPILAAFAQPPAAPFLYRR